MSLSSHHLRWLTSLALLPLLGVLIYLGEWYLFGGIVLFSTLGQYEFYSLLWPERERRGWKWAGVSGGAALLLFARLWPAQSPATLLLIAFWAANLGFLVQYSRRPLQTRYADCLILLAGLFYLPLMLQSFFVFTPAETVLVLIATFASDTGAYYAGTWFGRRKIWPSISPKKTWAGSAGGLVLCATCCLVLGVLVDGWPWRATGWWMWPLLGLLLNCAAQAGDFFESALKRSLEAKDSGSFLPGHGGVLDRIDSLLLVVPVYAVWRTIFAISP